ncbi:glucuronate isomerase [Bacillus safensis FO-36b] [Bacillus safensis subsp. safensis]
MALSSIGLISRFIGMLTDSRSFLSYTRHEYFRRLLCDIIGDWVEKGEAPYDLELLGEIVKGISYENARQYFQFDRANQLKHHPNKMT